MAYTASFTLDGLAAGLAATLRAALVDTAGTIHASLRDLDTGFVELGGNLYAWSSASIPAGYRGAAVFYVGSVGAGSDFGGVTVKDAAPVNPGELERPELALPNFAPGASNGLLIAGVNGGTTTFGALTVSGDTTLIGRAYLEGGLTASAAGDVFVLNASSGGSAAVLTGDGAGDALRLVAGASGYPMQALDSGLGVYAIRADLSGKVLGGGAGTIAGTGVWALDGGGSAPATAAALSTVSTRVLVALPNFAPGASNGLLARGTAAGQIEPSGGAVDLVASALTSVAAAVWGYAKATAAALATTTIGRYVYDTLASVAGQVAVLGTGQVAVYGAFVSGEVRIKQGDSYTEASGQAFDIPKPAGAVWPSTLSGWTITLRANANADTPGTGTRALQTTLTCADPAGAQTLRLAALTAAQTAGLDPGTNGWTFEIQATSGLEVNTLMSGPLSVIPNVTGA